MNTSRSRTARVLAMGAALIAGTLTTGAAEPGADSGSSRNNGVTVKSRAGVTLSGPDAHRFRLEEQRQLTADIYETAWTDGGTTIRVATRAQSRVRVENTRNGLTVDTTQMTDAAGLSESQLAARQQQRGMSAVEQQIALGMDPVQARKIFAPEAGLERGPVIDSWCVDISAEGGKLKSHGCNVRRLDQDDANGRYIADEMKTSAVSEDDDWWFPYKLNRVDSILIYGGSEEVVSWAPISDQPVAACGNITVSVEGEGGGASVTTPICPDTFGPSEIPSSGDPKFGAAWSGPAADPFLFMGTQGVTLVKQAKNPEPTTLRNKIRYTW